MTNKKAFITFITTYQKRIKVALIQYTLEKISYFYYGGLLFTQTTIITLILNQVFRMISIRLLGKQKNLGNFTKVNYSFIA